MILENAICLSTIILDCERIAWVEKETKNSILVYLTNGELIKLINSDAALLIKRIRCFNYISLSPEFTSLLDYLPEKEKEIEERIPF